MRAINAKLTAFLVLIIILAVSAFFFLPRKINLPGSDGGPRACFKNRCFFVRVAETEISRARGLMYQKSLAANAGMLFIFDVPGDHEFWMKNTLIPLDIIWIDTDKRIVSIKTAYPCATDRCPTIHPGSTANYVLEVNAGTAAALGLSIGDKVDLLVIK